MRIDKKHTLRLLVYALFEHGFRVYRVMLTRPAPIYIAEREGKRILVHIHFSKKITVDILDALQLHAGTMETDRSFLIVTTAPKVSLRKEARDRNICLYPLKSLKAFIDGDEEDHL